MIVIIIMIEGSEKHNLEVGLNFRVCVLLENAVSRGWLKTLVLNAFKCNLTKLATKNE